MNEEAGGAEGHMGNIRGQELEMRETKTKGGERVTSDGKTEGVGTNKPTQKLEIWILRKPPQLSWVEVASIPEAFRVQAVASTSNAPSDLQGASFGASLLSLGTTSDHDPRFSQGLAPNQWGWVTVLASTTSLQQDHTSFGATYPQVPHIYPNIIPNSTRSSGVHGFSAMRPSAPSTIPPPMTPTFFPSDIHGRAIWTALTHINATNVIWPLLPPTFHLDHGVSAPPTQGIIASTRFDSSQTESVRIFKVPALVDLSYQGFEVSFSTDSVPWNDSSVVSGLADDEDGEQDRAFEMMPTPSDAALRRYIKDLARDKEQAVVQLELRVKAEQEATQNWAKRVCKAAGALVDPAFSPRK
ncbi:hypothetical protein DFH94DRAFT_843583 [Russula ochroleuca]|uniref:Uncharacterized protein n=1 Tax=Russula ochroleuca TaxID=152965 RepID=A0A9P5MZ38_9AGAM|nr:hypothetical protein DFH94DRAFT_843583 [Russula ochroleuca]